MLPLLLVPALAGLPLPAQTAAGGTDNAHYKTAQQDLDNGDAAAAADEYEAALAADPKLADAHYELGVLYAEKLSEPVSAIYHLERYLKLAPNAVHAPAARDLVTTESEAFAASLPGSSSSAALAKLQIENRDLRKQTADAARTIGQLQMQLAAANARASAAPAMAQMTPVGTPNPASPAAEPGVVSPPPATGTVPAPVIASTGTGTLAATGTGSTPDAGGARTYTVKKGDKLWTIAKRMYPGHTKDGVDKIEEANKDAIGTKPLKIGQVLIIPEL